MANYYIDDKYLIIESSAKKLVQVGEFFYPYQEEKGAESVLNGEENEVESKTLLIKHLKRLQSL